MLKLKKICINVSPSESTRPVGEIGQQIFGYFSANFDVDP
jgi:hypothetical protein